MSNLNCTDSINRTHVELFSILYWIEMVVTTASNKNALVNDLKIPLTFFIFILYDSFLHRVNSVHSCKYLGMARVFDCCFSRTAWQWGSLSKINPAKLQLIDHLRNFVSQNFLWFSHSRKFVPPKICTRWNFSREIFTYKSMLPWFVCLQVSRHKLRRHPKIT